MRKSRPVSRPCTQVHKDLGRYGNFMLSFLLGQEESPFPKSLERNALHCSWKWNQLYPELKIHSYFNSSFISIFPSVDFHRIQAAKLNTEAGVHEKLLSWTGTSRFNLFIYSGQSKRSVLKYVAFYLSHARQIPVFLQEGLENTYSLLMIVIRIVAWNFDLCQLITSTIFYYFSYLAGVKIHCS